MSEENSRGLNGVSNNETLLRELKLQASRFSICDIMKIRTYMVNNVQNLPEKYRKIYSVDLFEYLYRTLQEIKCAEIMDTKVTIDQNKLRETNACIDKLAMAEHTEKMITCFFRTVTLYLIFIGNKPIHPLGMQFPGKLEILSRNGDYFCPAKEKQSEIEISLCKFCICKDCNEFK
ncbi:DUF2115 family protein [Methanohalophilus sp.]|uniref:DUF2115 family protein n=1 Tax=Methanohalophilus sp. TaxID=1966352 RepID=UPI00262C92C6|nr:DUF2115 family protein [Methanohalophilus sp.]MDK2892296.1 hypothetical protein [Methanohalophilus sp.]